MKIILPVALLYRAGFFIFICFSCFAALGQVTPLGAAVSGNQTNTIASFTVGAGDNRVLVVTASDGGTTSITSASFNGLPMTKRREQGDGFISVDAIFTLSLGSGTAVTGPIVFTSPIPSNVTKFISAAAFTKVNQATPFSDMKSGLANTGSSTLTVASSVGDLVFDIFDSWNNVAAGSQVPGAGQTVVNSSGALNFGTNNGFGFYSTGRKAGAPSVTTSWNATGHFANIHIAVNIQQDNIVLPLTLVSFTGAAKNKDAVLNWVTANEINVSHTEVQRSTNGTDFSFVSRLNKTIKSYVDVNAFNSGNNKLLYRLKLADLDGNFTYSPVLSIQAHNKASFITAIQPFFNAGRIAVSFNVPQEKNARLQLTDLSGKTIRTMALTVGKGISTSYMEDLQSLPAGIYLLQVNCGEERMTKKLLK
jgi:hypothetical protein